MQQQINLYQPVFRQEQKVFSSVTLAQIVGLVFVLLVAGTAYFEYGLQRLQRTERSLTHQFEQLDSQVASLRATLSSPETKQVEQEVTALEQELADKQALLEQFNRLLLDGGQGFSPYLQALGRRRVHGLWLTGLEIEGDGLNMTLRGVALKPDLVPHYLEDLPAETLLDPVHFRSVEVRRQEAGTSPLDFVLSTIPGGSAEDREGLL